MRPVFRQSLGGIAASLGEDSLDGLLPRGDAIGGIHGSASGCAVSQLGHAGCAYVLRRPALPARVLERPTCHQHVSLDLVTSVVRHHPAFHSMGKRRYLAMETLLNPIHQEAAV